MTFKLFLQQSPDLVTNALGIVFLFPLIHLIE